MFRLRGEVRVRLRRRAMVSIAMAVPGEGCAWRIASVALVSVATVKYSVGGVEHWARLRLP